MSRRLVWPKPSFSKKESVAPPVVEKPTEALFETEPTAEVDPEPQEESTPEPVPQTIEVEKKNEIQVEEAPKKEEKSVLKRYQPLVAESSDAPSPSALRIAEFNEVTGRQETPTIKSADKPVWAKRVLPVEPVQINPPAQTQQQGSTPTFSQTPSVSSTSSSKDPQNLEAIIQKILSPALESIQTEIKKMKRVVSQKFQELEARLDREEEARAKITTWIRTNIGPNLEKVREIAQEEAKAAASANQLSSTSSLKSSKSSSTSSPSSKAQRAATISTSSRMDFNDAPSTIANETHVSTPQIASPSRDPRIRPRRVAANQKLQRLEEETFGASDVERVDMPSNDAAAKVGLSRANYFLTTQSHATNQYRCPELYEKVRNFADKGGNVVFVPLTDADRKKDSFVFSIKSNDRVYPVCPDGLNRSQVLYLALAGMKRALGVSTDSVALPHGARCGFDPFVMRDDPEDTSKQYYHIVSKGKRARTNAKIFMDAFGQDKVARFGEETCGPAELRLRADDDDDDKKRDALNEVQTQQIMKARQRMREYFDLYYYNLKTTNAEEAKGRRIYIAFGSAVPIVIDRILESNYRQDVPKALIVALPFGVEPYEKPSAQDLKILYKFYASLFAPVAERVLRLFFIFYIFFAGRVLVVFFSIFVAVVVCIILRLFFSFSFFFIVSVERISNDGIQLKFVLRRLVENFDCPKEANVKLTRIDQFLLFSILWQDCINHPIEFVRMHDGVCDVRVADFDESAFHCRVLWIE